MNKMDGIKFKRLIVYLFISTFFVSSTLAQENDSIQCQTIVLQEGWSIFSTFIEVEDSECESIQSYLSKGGSNVVIIKDNFGNAYLPYWDMACNINFNNTQGYYIKVYEPDTFQFCGQIINTDENMIMLNQGWNIIPYLYDYSIDLEVALSDILNDIFLVKDIYGNVYYPEMNYNGIGNLTPGNGYQIKINSPNSFYYSN